jgi:hypothetical protein
MPKFFKSLITASLCTVILFACKKIDKEEQISSPTTQEKQTYVVSKDGKIILGKKLENPYSVQMMQKAYNSLKSKNSARIAEGESPVRTTHYYVRFLPENQAQYETLKEDTLLKLYITPLDQEVTVHGWDYHDLSLPAGSITWQYTTVKVNYTFDPTIKHEILASLYLPETDSELNQNTDGMRLAGKSFVDALVDEAMILTKNYSDTLKVDTAANGRTSWDPMGTVQVFDTRLGTLIPLVGVKMRARRWFDIREGYTNNAGYYQLPGFKRDANYALFYESSNFDVRTGTFGQAWIDGPKQSSPWDVTLSDGVLRFYAHVFRGAHRYHHGNIGGLTRANYPTRLKYAAHDKPGSSQGVNLGNWSVFYINPNILIYRYSSSGAEYASDEIFSTTCHETCHSTHVSAMNAGYIQYSQVSTFIAESWPVAVEWFITQMEYREKGISNYGSESYSIPASFPLDRGYQFWTKGTSANYTPIFIDLVDNFNQSSLSSALPNDNVSGYTLANIESTFLKNSYGLSSLRTALKNNKPAGVTDAQIDLLLSSYE